MSKDKKTHTKCGCPLLLEPPVMPFTPLIKVEGDFIVSRQQYHSMKFDADLEVARLKVKKAIGLGQ